MTSSILRVICALRRNSCGCGGGRRMMSSTTAIEPSRISPWLMLQPSSEDGSRFYSLALDKVMSFNKEAPSADGLVKLVGSSHGWVASFNLDNQHIFLSNPITGRHMKLPDIHTLPQSSFHPQCRTIVDKIVLSSSPAADADECRALMTFNASGMALCCPGRSSKWILVGDGFYEDFVYSSGRKRLFSITSDHDAECWDLTDPDSPTIVWKDSISNLDDGNNSTDSDEEDPVGEVWRYPRYLVFDEQSDRLFAATRHVLERIDRNGSYAKTIYLGLERGFDGNNPYKTFGFDVHEIDWKGGKIRYMDGSLDGLAMFVGNNHSFALSAAEFPELKPDSIYFTDDGEFTPLDDDYRSYGGHDIGIFNYMDRTLSSIYYSCHVSDITRIVPAPMWFTPTL